MSFYVEDTVTVYHGDCLDVLATLPDGSVDAVVTDPPYGLEFMGKTWDSFKGEAWRSEWRVKGQPLDRRNLTHMHAFQAWCQLWAAECLRVLKPGGHLLAFGGTRTNHRLACAIEDAGFEIRDSIAWLYGSGFPKSLDVSKAIDKAAGAEREVIGPNVARHGGGLGVLHGGGIGADVGDITAPASDAARTWQGWGTALKPAHEPIVVARKPLVGTAAGNVLAHGTGALNIDGCRINLGDPVPGGGGLSARGSLTSREYQAAQGYRPAGAPYPADTNGGSVASHTAGRWPANVVLDESQAAALDQQSGELVSGNLRPYANRSAAEYRQLHVEHRDVARDGDSGGASRFFYTAKADAAERVRIDGTSHPTVKPLALMRWLVRLVTPHGGVVLEPFAGSGTTVEACILEGFRCVAIEREADYLPLILQRIRRRRDPVAAVLATAEDGGLFDLLGEEPA